MAKSGNWEKKAMGMRPKLQITAKNNPSEGSRRKGLALATKMTWRMTCRIFKLNTTRHVAGFKRGTHITSICMSAVYFCSAKMGGSARKRSPLPLASLNHISRNCIDIQKSIDFYCNVLGFVQIRRPGALKFDGAWLFNYGIGIHLLQAEDVKEIERKSDEINVRADHVSFQCEDLDEVVQGLEEAGIKYERRIVEERGIEVEQIFFHDPDNFMIEVCTCEKLPVEPLGASVCSNIFKLRQAANKGNVLGVLL